MELDAILSSKNPTYSKVKKYIDKYDENNYYKIIGGLNKFSKKDVKVICKNIIINSNDRNIIERVCMDIDVLVAYEYDYYKEIISIISTKGITGQWIDVLNKRLLKDSKKTLEDVFSDFSLKVPCNIKYDLAIICALFCNYNDRYIDEVEIEKKKIIEICKKVNHIMSIYIKNIFKFLYCVCNKYELTKKECETFVNEFFYNYPQECREFIKKSSYDNKCAIICLIKEKIEDYEYEESIKNGMEIFKPDMMRMLEYRKYQFKINQKINKMAKEYSIIDSLFKQSTILYGKKVRNDSSDIRR